MLKIALLKKTFQEKYGNDLVTVLSGELSGDLKKVILTAMRGEVADFDASVHTSAKASTDAEILYKAGEGKHSVDAKTFIDTLVLSPVEHVRGISSAYEAKYKTSLAGAVEAEFSGDAKRALLFLVRSVLEPENLLVELFETTLKGGSKNVYGLSACVVRYHRLLVRIRIVYMRLYHQELRTRIQGVVSGEYSQLLLSVLDAAETEFGTSASGPVSASTSVAVGEGVSSDAIDTSVSTEKAGISSGATVSTTSKESGFAGSKTAVSTMSDEKGTAELAVAGSTSMSSLYVRYARESSSIESMTFPAEIDAAVQEIHRVCSSTTSAETSLASLLLSKTVEQRYLIWWRYRILYKQSLTTWVKSTSDYGVLLKMLASPLEHVEAEILRKATVGLGTTEKWIYPVVMARTNAEIALLKKTFQEKYGNDLVTVLSGELSGDLKKVILTAMRGEVADFDASVHTSAKASTDAEILYKAGEGMRGTDAKTFIDTLVLSPVEHVRGISSAYEAKYKKTSVIKAIKGEFRGDAQKTLLFYVRMATEPFEVVADLLENTMKGFGTDEYGLSAGVVRYCSMLPEIKIAYKKQYGKDLGVRIRKDTSGKYRDLLVAIVDKEKE
uniref:Annexin n=1 Tax=Hyaloperonospora arabidopsidis (strain Emoy2) TaxID=559515 RepID=M4BXY7_HYAAE